MLQRTAALFFVSAIVAIAAHAQERGRNEIGLLLGGTVTPDLSISGPPGDSIDFGAGVTFQATYARHLIDGPRERLSFEVPFFASPTIKAGSANLNIPLQYASLFVTPGLRLTFSHGALLSPWVSVGGGYALSEHASELLSGAPNNTNNTNNRHTGTVQFGGGIDIRTPIRVLFPISLRLEVRDLYAGKPTFNVDTGGGFQHNVVFSGGFVVHF